MWLPFGEKIPVPFGEKMSTPLRESPVAAR
jgi:hypothetical protein